MLNQLCTRCQGLPSRVLGFVSHLSNGPKERGSGFVKFGIRPNERFRMESRSERFRMDPDAQGTYKDAQERCVG